MDQYIITILKNGKLYDEVIFKSNNVYNALDYMSKAFNRYVCNDRSYTMHLAFYYGNGRKGKMIAKLKMVNAYPQSVLKEKENENTKRTSN